jgi:hypothetical protein
MPQTSRSATATYRLAPIQLVIRPNKFIQTSGCFGTSRSAQERE